MMKAWEVRQICNRGFKPLCPPAYAWLDQFEDGESAVSMLEALPSRYSTWIRVFLRRAKADLAVYEGLWDRYIDLLASCETDAYDAWKEECFEALKADVKSAYGWIFEMSLLERAS